MWIPNPTTLKTLPIGYGFLSWATQNIFHPFLHASPLDIWNPPPHSPRSSLP